MFPSDKKLFCDKSNFLTQSDGYIVEQDPGQGSKGRLQATSLDPQRVQQISSLCS